MPAADSFFDTNVLLCLLSDDAVKADRAEALLAAGGVISVQVLNEFAAVAIGRKAVGFADLRDILSTIRGICTVTAVDVETHELGLEIAERSASRSTTASSSRRRCGPVVQRSIPKTFSTARQSIR